MAYKVSFFNNIPYFNGPILMVLCQPDYKDESQQDPLFYPSSPFCAILVSMPEDKPYYEQFDEEVEEDPRKGSDWGGYIEKNRFYLLLVYTALIVGCTWAVAYWGYIEPRNFEIARLDQKLAERDKEIGRLKEDLAKAQEHVSSIILEPTWVESGKSISTPSGRIAVRYNSFLSPAFERFHIYRAGEKPGVLSLRPGESGDFEYAGEKYLFNLLEVDMKRRAARISIARAK